MYDIMNNSPSYHNPMVVKGKSIHLTFPFAQLLQSIQCQTLLTLISPYVICDPNHVSDCYGVNYLALLDFFNQIMKNEFKMKPNNKIKHIFIDLLYYCGSQALKIFTVRISTVQLESKAF